jgi:hypothetical protein
LAVKPKSALTLAGLPISPLSTMRLASTMAGMKRVHMASITNSFCARQCDDVLGLTAVHGERLLHQHRLAAVQAQQAFSWCIGCGVAM